jgi:hypothetical protein
VINIIDRRQNAVMIPSVSVAALAIGPTLVGLSPSRCPSLPSIAAGTRALELPDANGRDYFA